MIAFVNLGPRYPATRAAMAAGASKTDTAASFTASQRIVKWLDRSGSPVPSATGIRSSC